MTDDDDIVRMMLGKIEKRYGSVPLVNRILSERADLFVPSVKFSTAVIEGKSEFDRKTRYLFAVAAATALGSEHCIGVQLDHAVQAGATRDEVIEVMSIASLMAMTRSQSVAFRKFEEKFGDRGEV
jgi:alkylhydroperoxidase/carboxymuconolactone decarboxylase family protein YurZ